MLDALAIGDLIHRTLDGALCRLEANGGLAGATAQQIAAAVDSAAADVAALWETERAVPPGVIWRHSLDLVRELSRRALAFADERLPGTRASARCRSGVPRKSGALPDPLHASSSWHRLPYRRLYDWLDISGDGRCAPVRDYKTGRMPRRDRADGGRSCSGVHAFAVKAMPARLPSASLLFPRDASSCARGCQPSSRPPGFLGKAQLGPSGGGAGGHRRHMTS